MADLADVEDALLQVAAAAFYPAGTNGGSTIGAECRLYRGWPTPSGLNADLTGGVVNVTIFPSDAAGATLTALPIEYRREAVDSDFTVAVALGTATFSGSPRDTDCAGVLVDDASYVYRPTAGDTAASVAAHLAQLIQGDRVAYLAGASLTVPNSHRLIARVVSDQVSYREVRRQNRSFVFACWCPTPGLRDAAAQTIDVAMAQSPFLPLADGSSARVSYQNTAQYDQAQNALLYRRDLFYLVEYPTVVRVSEPSMLFADLRMGQVELQS
ncbi:MAG: hypothetical protein BGO51_02100 [Rhodospirillales bacterium 69-11]|nr:hypothetical protein [Rhodospirillales bacterium]MBN8901537.1 hypothetical protein [Rhodospirillales bacterium]MBN8908879.1 hypothetical protein [Rhodospirillales bacterium]MBN8928829.1 hypothetical protein [Rhodospirillales bacterium]OJW25391.1 MAG: hypothetical protein BGO51_02100 [Rhodospirillales bacterium 69-11]